MAAAGQATVDIIVNYITRYQQEQHLIGGKTINVGLDSVFVNEDGVDFETIRKFTLMKAFKLDLSQCCGIDSIVVIYLLCTFLYLKGTHCLRCFKSCAYSMVLSCYLHVSHIFIRCYLFLYAIHLGWQ